MKIKLENLSASKFTLEEKAFFAALELSESFEKRVFEIREKFEIPRDGFPVERENEIGMGIPKYLPDNLWNEYLRESSRLISDFDITPRWGVGIAYFLIYNVLPRLSGSEHKARINVLDWKGFEYYAKNLDYFRELICESFYIHVSEKMSKSRFLDYLDSNWEELGIARCMELLPKWSPPKGKRVRDFLEIKQARDKRESYPDISTKLTNKCNEKDERRQDFVAETANLKNLVSRFKKKATPSKARQ